MQTAKPEYHVASFSGGKDSTAMVLRMIELQYPLDEVLFCDTTMEFPAMLRHVEKVKQVVEATGIKFTVIRAEHDFEHYMLRHKPKRRKSTFENLPGYSWPGPLSRWCTSKMKTDVINRHLRELRSRFTLIQYIGIAADEEYRLTRQNNQDPDHHHPLVEWGWTEADAMRYCLEKGYDWEGLYNLFDRVSCWCCPLQSLHALRNLREHFPDLWQRLEDMDKQTWRNFGRKEWSVEKLGMRFALEDALTENGHSIRDRRFFADLKRLLANEATVEEIMKERGESNEQNG